MFVTDSGSCLLYKHHPFESNIPFLEDNMPNNLAKCPRNNFKKCIRNECSLWIEMDMRNEATREKRTEGHCKDVWEVIMRNETNRELAGMRPLLGEIRNALVKFPNSDVLKVIARSLAGLYEAASCVRQIDQ